MGNTYMKCVLSLYVIYIVAKNAAQSESDILLDDYSIIPYGQSEVHGIDASETAIAMATSDRLYLYNLTRPVQLIGKINLDSPVTEQPGFLELKLLNDAAIGYCDTTVCCYCTFQLNNASCKSLNLTFDDVTSSHMTSASMAFDYPLLTLRLVDNKDRSAILRFDVLEPSSTTTLRVKQYSIDLKTGSKQFTIKGFVREGYSYFVGTNSPTNNPTRNGSSLEKTAMIITRICNNDSTLQLYSRMDQHINCSRTATGITAAYYDPKREQLWIIVRSQNHAEMCRFEMKMVHEQFSNNWQICIKNSESNVIKFCERKTSSNALPDYCHIYNHRAHNASRPCFSSKLSIPISNCEMQQGSSDEYQFGWLENTQPSTGKGLLGFSEIAGIRTNIVPDTIYNNTFQSLRHKDYSAVQWIPTHHLSSISTVQFLKTKKLFPTMRHNIALSGNTLFMTNMNAVGGGGLKAPVKCVWCADLGHQMAMSLQDPSNTCEIKITDTCHAITERNRSAALLRRRKNATVSTVTTKKTPGNLITSLNEVKENGMDWLLLSVLAGVLFMLLVLSGFIVWELKRLVSPYSECKRPTSLEENSRPLLTGTAYTDENCTPESIISALSLSSSRSKYDCGNIFKYIDENIKISMSQLQLEETIGEGNFGVVLSGTYSTPDGDIIKVACKLLKDGETGVKTFFDEGLIMMNFYHPHVIHFIGIALANDTDPIIVTKFMTNGNLLDYLQNNSDNISGEQLQGFATQIAEGMEYLHSKKFIHRDLAARNCMLDYKMQLKIGDFGLARQCNDENMYLSEKYPKVPFAWASIEALEFGTFTLKGDVWSYGVVLWELMTKGEKPYFNYTPSGLLTFLKQGKRLYQPPNCSEKFYTSIMVPCWAEDINKRPSFSEIIGLLNSCSSSLVIDCE